MNIINKIKNKAVALGLIMLAFSSAAFAGDTGGFSVGDMDVFTLLIGMMIFFIILIVVVADAIKRIVSNKELWKDKEKSMGSKVLSIAVLMVLGMTSFDALAAGGEEASGVVMTDDLFWILVSINVFLFCVLLFLVGTLKSLIKKLRDAEEQEGYMSESADVKILGIKLTDNVAIENEQDIMMDHDYDGIRELDNNLPPWWVYGFYITIFFAFVYVIHFHIATIPGLDKLVLLGPVEKGTQAQQYNMEMKEANEQKAAFMAKMANAVDETSVELVTDEARLAKGKDIYKANCVACHGANGEGGVGPNFADEYWLHGGGIKNVFKTIKYGVPAKGMISWEAQLSPSQIQEVASYLLSFKGTNPANGKEPQGEIWKEEAVIEESPLETPVANVDSTGVTAEIIE